MDNTSLQALKDVRAVLQEILAIEKHRDASQTRIEERWAELGTEYKKRVAEYDQRLERRKSLDSEAEVFKIAIKNFHVQFQAMTKQVELATRTIAQIAKQQRRAEIPQGAIPQHLWKKKVTVREPAGSKKKGK